MTTFSPDDLAAWSGGQWIAPPTAPITGFCFDSRKVAQGDLFVALKSDKADGHDYLPLEVFDRRMKACADAGITLASESVICNEAPDAAALEECAALGAALE